MSSDLLPTGYKRTKYIYGMEPSDKKEYNISSLPIEIPIKLSSNVVALNFEGGISNAGVFKRYNTTRWNNQELATTNGTSAGDAVDTYLSVQTTLYDTNYHPKIFLGNFYAGNKAVDCDIYNSFDTKDTILIYRGVSRSVDSYVKYINGKYYRPFKYSKLSVNVTGNTATVYNNIKIYNLQTSLDNRSYTGSALQEFLNGTTLLSINPAYYLIFSFNMTDSNNKKIVDLIPCCRKSDGVYGLYDTVSKAFYTCSNETYMKNNLFGGNDLIYGGATPK